MMCFKGTFNIDTADGICPEDCEHGGWNGGVCGAECKKCGGDLYLNDSGTVVCVDCESQNNIEIKSGGRDV